SVRPRCAADPGPLRSVAVPDCVLARSSQEGSAGGTSRSREVSTTVLIWGAPGFSSVPDTKGRMGSRAVHQPMLGPDPTNMMEVGMDGKRVIGVDIGKRWLDAAREDAAAVERWMNEAATIAAVVATFDVARDVVVFERCGGYERALEAALAAAGVAWAVVHSASVKAFRQGQGIKAKTDTIDARRLQ